MVSSPTKLLKRVRFGTLTLSLLGIVLSAYSVFVHYKKGTDKDYTAFCDIREDISCSKVFTSKYGTGFGLLSSLLGEDSPLLVSNGVYGIVFYALVILLGEFASSLVAATIQKIIVLLTNVMSVYLGYILLFVLNDKCVVCISIYAINLIIAALCIARVSYLSAYLKTKKKGGSKNEKTKNASQQNNKKDGKKGQNNAKNAQNSTKKEQQNSNKKEQQNSNKNNQISNKNTQNSKKQSDNVSNRNAVNNKKNLDQNKNISNSTKSQQNSTKNSSSNAPQKGSSNKSNANNTKHSKKKN